MKSLLTTLLLFVLMLGGITANALYVNHVADDLEQAILSLPDVRAANCVSSVSALQASWERRADFIEFASGFSAVDRISEHLSSLLACASLGDVYGYHAARVLLLDAVSDMRRPENLSLGTIF